MVVLLTDREVLSPGQVCRQCLFASTAGEPRFQDGQVICGRGNAAQAPATKPQCCPMGFRVVEMPDPAA
jgi:hypothetical protein